MPSLLTKFGALILICQITLLASTNPSAETPQKNLAKKRLKILVYSPTIGWSHMQFMGSIADTLVGAGHDVHLFRVLMNKRAEALPKEVFNVTNFHNFLPNFVQTGKLDINKLDDLKEPFDGKSFNTFLFQTLLRRLQAEHFDVVISELYDPCPMALFHRIGAKTKLGALAVPLFQTAARNFGIPTLSSYVTSLFTPMNGGHKMNFVERIVNFVNDLYDWLYLNNLMASYEEPVIAEAFGQNFPPLKQIMRNVSLLFTNSNQFFEMPRPISNKIINIGGIVEMKVKELDPGIKAIVDNSLNGTVIVSFGTFADINSMKSEMKMAFLEAFAHFPNYEFIWKVELSDEDAKVFAKYKNVHPVKWMDQKSLLMHPKMRAFVSHCGLNSVSEAVQFGVPILAIPLLADQLYNAIMARVKGIAVQLDVGQLNRDGAEQLLVDGLDKVLNYPSYRQNVKLLKQKFVSTPFGAKEKLIKWVEFAAEFHDLNELNLPWEEELGTLAYYSVDIILLIVAMCWLKIIAEGNKWQRKPLLHFSELVRMDLIKAALIASHCAEISYDGEKGRIEEEYGQIELLLSEIAAHMVDWICAKLIITWPIISSEYAKTAIGNSPIIESEAEYEKVALNIKHVLDQMGEEKYLHTVIVFPNWTDERQLASICSVQYCFKLTDINGINVFVVRYEDDQYERAVRTSEWFTPTIQIKMIKIISDWWESNRSEPLIGLAWRMKHEFEELINANFYANLVLIRNWMFFSSAATMTLGVTPTKIRSARTELGFNYKIIPPILDAEIFHIHMLI
ncbi:hypothetical protein niasHT_008921 [Heterodera trifolii]|uniref:glucuronosyltransferase n=1 Tax=Heterodera trifolii TaxID=157864 RepID=A0ABD2LY54_9BILA